ncbi:rod-binding protein [Yoonia sp.]|uniref:rod-binding protein n=1 Tax=Yoonia sp. TaxID=2212373 RepID=UPI0023B714B9
MNTIPVLPPPRPASPIPDYIQNDAKLRDAAIKLEATFLSEMLKSAGLGAMPESFGGGAGEQQFASYLRQAQADEMAKGGGIGLAEALFEAMKERFRDS